MTQAALTEEQLREAADAYIENGRTATRAAAALGLHASTFDNRLRQAKLKGFVPDNPGPGFEIKQESVRYNADGQEIGRTVTSKPEAGEEFKVPEGYSIKGESALVGPDGRVNAKWIKTDRDVAKGELLVDAMKSALKGVRTYPVVKAPKHADKDLLCVLPIFDLHMGLLSYASETGAAYDSKIAAKMAKDSISSLIASSPSAATGLIILGGDVFHVDSQSNTSQSGHQLDVDSRYSKILVETSKLVLDLVAMMLQRHKKIHLACVPGNHDAMSVESLKVGLAMAFAGNKRVEVDMTPGLFYFHRHGKVLLGAVHGHTTKPRQLPGIMANMRAKDWGETTHRVFMSGHFHNEETMTHDGVVCRQFKSTARRDSYTASRGFFGPTGYSALTFHKEYGPTVTVDVSIPALDADIAA